MTEQDHIRMLRDQLAALRARHDSGAIPHATYNVIHQLETEIAWHEHRAAERAAAISPAALRRTVR
jgi:hypothetical protein